MGCMCASTTVPGVPDVYKNPARADNVVPLTQLSTDLSAGTVPHFVWISPNICNDMHGGATACPYPNSPTDPLQAALYKDGDNFLRTWWGASPTAAPGPAIRIFITWDEGGFEDQSRSGLPTSGPGPTPRSCQRPPPIPLAAAAATCSAARCTAWPRSDARGSQRRRASRRLRLRRHYSLLQTIEQNFGLPLLGDAGDIVQVKSLSPLLH